MNKYLALLCLGLLAYSFGVPAGFADSLGLLGGRTITGTVLQTNEVNVLILTELGTVSYPRAIVKEMKIERAEAADFSSTNRVPDFKKFVVFLAQQPWASDLKQIPATVIDNGVLRAVPYVSFRCGEDYEVNVYGDPDDPSAIEVGVYRKLLQDGSARNNCTRFIGNILGRSTDKEIVQHLDLAKDLKSSDGWTFEITPASAPDAYAGWWVSVYSEQKLNLARASDEELKQISIAKSEVAKGAGGSQDPSAWSANDLRLARPSEATLTFQTKSGLEITNAQVKPYVEGVSLIWRDTNGGGGVVKLADLPEDLRRRFGYDPAKASAADEQEKEKRARDLQWQANAAAAINNQQQAQAQARAAQASEGANWNFGSSTYSGSSSGGSVYVRGYTRKNGTYVHGYTRRR